MQSIFILSYHPLQKCIIFLKFEERITRQRDDTNCKNMGHRASSLSRCLSSGHEQLNLINLFSRVIVCRFASYNAFVVSLSASTGLIDRGEFLTNFANQFWYWPTPFPYTFVNCLLAWTVFLPFL